MDRRNVYQLLFTMRTGERDSILKYKATKKTQATFTLIDHIHFLTEKTGWKITKVHLYYTFEYEPFKKEYILGNQRARQEAVARGDDLQANFRKLVNNAYFGFDCRGNSRNKYLHLIYDENVEVEFISKYNRYDANNCFLYLDARIKNIEEYYSNLDNLEDDGQSYAETLKQEEIKRVIETYNSLEFIVIVEESCD